MDIRQTLKDKNLRVTNQRKLILKAFLEDGNPISAEDLYDLLRNEIELDLSTIYRNLNTLEENGILLRSIDLNGVSYYQLNNADHKHFITCNICHKKFLIDSCPVHILEDKIEKDTGFIISGHNFEFTGICPDCQKSL
ncbi:Fur family transcriptional regulator [Anaerococcus sp. AGMB09787]|uniref:Fur family transcriptional regulator n=1 Tax=Anaerococcus sp. AGMB09787 TaxID=2922869 RepID=UPI001FAF1D57|nr:Fur family transcriptional regulator [Anaerococcus sp. AGMB09787]